MLISRNNVFLFIVAIALCGTVSLLALPPIVQVVTPDGTVDIVPTTEERWGVPSGTAGSRDKPIVIPDTKSVTFKIGDPSNPSWPPGSVDMVHSFPFTMIDTSSLGNHHHRTEFQCI